MSTLILRLTWLRCLDSICNNLIMPSSLYCQVIGVHGNIVDVTKPRYKVYD